MRVECAVNRAGVERERERVLLLFSIQEGVECLKTLFLGKGREERDR